MLIKPDITGTNSYAAAPASTACGNCGVEVRRLLHHVRHRGIFRRLCTSCVLRLHPQSFCPTCFQVYPPPPPNDAVRTCFKCYSSSHSHCVEAAGPSSPPKPYVCPLCIQPNTPIFKLKSTKESNGDDFKAMDKDSAKKLLAAAKIASISMNKAAAAARAESERRSQEAAYTRKRAKEALEYVDRLEMKEKLRKKELSLAGSSRVGINAGYASGGVMRIDRENSNVNVGGASYRNGNACRALGRPMVADGRIVSGGNVNNSNKILTALNGSGSKANGKTRGTFNMDSGCTPMDVDRNNDGGGDFVNFENMEGLVENVDNLGEKLDDIDDDDDDEADLVQFVEDHLEDSYDEGEEIANGSQL